jgi:hypothetical protein
MVRRRSSYVSLLVCSIAALVLAPSAGAAITASQITSPANPAFATYDDGAPNSIVIAGTTSGGAGGDQVDVDCFTGTEAVQLETGVPLAANGSFFVSAANLEIVRGRLCRLRAVPAGTTPADPTPYAGPVLATGFRRVETFPSPGPLARRANGFVVNAQQLTAGASFRSFGRCGPIETFLDNGSLERTATTFACGSRFWRFNDYDEPAKSTRSQIQIDGVNAYAAATVNEMFGPIAGFPVVSTSSSQDPVTGNVVVHDDETLVACPTPAYPPSGGCSSLVVGTGVRDERTIESSEDSHLVTVTDRYSSTDGQAHMLDLLPENEQLFAGSGEEHAGAIAYRFPGESSFATHVSGDVVSFGDEAPAAISVAVEGRPDGDQSSGRGAIVFDRPASPATFNLLTPKYSGFELHQTATVPASGSTDFRTAYVQAFTAGEVEAIVARVERSFAPPPAPAPPARTSATQGATPPPPLAKGTIRKVTVKLDKHKGTATLLVSVDAAGTVRLSGKGLAAARATAAGAGVVKLTVRAKGAARRQLLKDGRARVRATLTFLPASGASVSAVKPVVLRKRLG